MFFFVSVFHDQNKTLQKKCEKLHREHPIGCQGVKLYLLKDVAITTVTTAIVTNVTLATVTIWVYEFCHNLTFWVVTIWLFEFTILVFRFYHIFLVLLEFDFFCHTLCFWVQSQFEFLSFVTIWLFKLTQFEFSSFVTIEFSSLLTVSVFKSCHALSF